MTALYVANLPFDASAADVNELAAVFGEVASVRLARESRTGRSLGFAFVYMEDEDAAERAAQALNRREWRGRLLRATLARPRDDRARVS